MFKNKKYITILISGFFLIVFAFYSTYLSISGEEDFWGAIKRYRRDNLYAYGGKWMNHEGRYISLSDFRGTNIVLSLVYLECSVSCPLIIQKLKLLEKKSEQNNNRVKFVVILLEDLTGKPEILQQYRKRYSIDSDRWILLTSDYKTLDKLTGGYGIYYEKTDSAFFQTTHTNVIAFIGSDGQFKREIRNISRFDPVKTAEWMNNKFL